MKIASSPGIDDELREMMEAGLAEEDDLYVRVDELQAVRERTLGPDVRGRGATSVTLHCATPDKLSVSSRKHRSAHRTSP